MNSSKREKTLEYIKWRNAVINKEKHICFICGKREENMEAHHLNRWRDYPEQRYDINNGICICKKNHIILTNTEKKLDALLGIENGDDKITINDKEDDKI